MLSPTPPGGSEDPEHSELVDEQVRADLEQTDADTDQTAADADQGASDADGAAAIDDQQHADLEQRASDRDQAAADQERAAVSLDTATDLVFDASRAQRADASAIREASAVTRADNELTRTRQAMQRDQTARLRDLTAASRDRAANARDSLAERQARRLLGARPVAPSLQAALAADAAARAHAAADRQRAAEDRQRAAADRAQAAIDRRHGRIDLQRAHLDSLTGVYMRDLGRVTLQHEIDRAHRSGEPFSVAYVDVDDLKLVNDRDGHAAGDRRLQAVVTALKAELRTYDPIVRVGGDEFVCGLVNTGLAEAEARCEDLRGAALRQPHGGSVTIGLAFLGADVDLDAVIARADADLYARKAARKAPPA